MESNRKIYLDVPFKDKEEAKALGARWDLLRRSWYHMAGETGNTEVFAKWFRFTHDQPEVQEQPIELNGREYFTVNDAMRLFEAATHIQIHNTKLGQILKDLKVDRLGYMRNGSSGYPTDRWGEIWEALVTLTNKRTKRKETPLKLEVPKVPTRSEPLYRVKVIDHFYESKNL